VFLFVSVRCFDAERPPQSLWSFAPKQPEWCKNLVFDLPLFKYNFAPSLTVGVFKMYTCSSLPEIVFFLFTAFAVGGLMGISFARRTAAPSANIQRIQRDIVEEIERAMHTARGSNQHAAELALRDLIAPVLSRIR
jgi:hypothetical protein